MEKMNEIYISDIKKRTTMDDFGHFTTLTILIGPFSGSAAGYVVMPILLPFALAIDLSLIPVNISYNVVNGIKRARLKSLGKNLVYKEQKDKIVSNRAFEKTLIMFGRSIEQLDVE
jgi:hypothetical protein